MGQFKSGHIRRHIERPTSSSASAAKRQPAYGFGDQACKPSLPRQLAGLLSKPDSFATAYDAGFDAGINGSDTENCSFKWFNTKESSQAWTRGNNAGLAKKGKE